MSTSLLISPILTVPVHKLPHAPEILPFYATAGSAGMDVAAAIDCPMTLQPLERALIPTGLIIALPHGYECQIRPRSGLSIKHGITLINAVGTIDSDYRQEVKVPLVNLSQNPYTLQPGDRIAQMIIAPVTRIAWSEITREDLSTFENTLSDIPNAQGRSGGFGSTGR